MSVYWSHLGLGVGHDGLGEVFFQIEEQAIAREAWRLVRNGEKASMGGVWKGQTTPGGLCRPC